MMAYTASAAAARALVARSTLRPVASQIGAAKMDLASTQVVSSQTAPLTAYQGLSASFGVVSSTLLPNVVESYGHRLCRYRLSLRLTHHRLREEPIPQTAALLIRHFGLCPLRGHGSLLSYDGFFAVIRVLNAHSPISFERVV